MKKESNKKLEASANKASQIKKPKSKNLSPAKKFRLRLRRAKFQKQSQNKDDYFEHDNRSIGKVSVEKKARKASRLVKKGQQAQLYIDAYLKSQQMSLNCDTASQDGTPDSSNANEVSIKSIVHRKNIGLSPVRSQLSHAFGKDLAIQRVFPTVKSSFPSFAENISSSKCCCHCACSVKKKKPRRKLSSPYFGDFDTGKPVSFAKGSCMPETKTLNNTTMTTHRATFVNASDFANFKPLTSKVTIKHQQPLLFNKNVQGRSGSGSSYYGLKAVHSVMRFVPSFIRHFSESDTMFVFRFLKSRTTV